MPLGGIRSPPPASVSPKPRFVRDRRRGRFALLAITSEPGFRTAISELVQREIAITFLATFVISGFEPLLDLVGLLGQFRD